jgi:hypothetical protein
MELKQLNVRLTPGLYDAVQSLLQEKLNMDVSTFVRELFIDALLIYGNRERIIEALTEMGQSYRIKQGPGLVLEMADQWRERDKSRIEKQYAELLKAWQTRPAGKVENGGSKRKRASKKSDHPPVD